MKAAKNGEEETRRQFLRSSLRGVAALALTAVTGLAARRRRNRQTVWQLDPNKCVQCGRCATECVLSPSAVKCVHDFTLCGYCDFCIGYYQPYAKVWDTSAENQLCPVCAIQRRYIEGPYYEYQIDEALCIGCGKCVKGCARSGNGSLYLQVQHDLCVNCNDCAIARACPADAYMRVPADTPYIAKKKKA